MAARCGSVLRVRSVRQPARVSGMEGVIKDGHSFIATKVWARNNHVNSDERIGSLNIPSQIIAKRITLGIGRNIHK